MISEKMLELATLEWFKETDWQIFSAEDLWETQRTDSRRLY